MLCPADAAAVLHLHEAALGKRRDHARGTRHHRRELGHAHRAGCKGLDHLALAACVLARREGAAGISERGPAVVDGLGAVADELPGALVALAHAHRLAGRKHEAQARRQGRGVLAGHPQGKARRRLVKGRRGKHALNAQHAQRVHALRHLGRSRDDVAHDVPVAKAHEDGAAGHAARLELSGDGVVKAPVNGAGGYVGNDLCVSHGSQFATLDGQKETRRKVMAFRLVMRFKRDKELRPLCHLFLKELGTLASAVEAQGEKASPLRAPWHMRPLPSPERRVWRTRRASLSTVTPIGHMQSRSRLRRAPPVHNFIKIGGKTFCPSPSFAGLTSCGNQRNKGAARRPRPRQRLLISCWDNKGRSLIVPNRRKSGTEKLRAEVSQILVRPARPPRP